MQQWRINGPASWTMFVFGVIAAVLGAAGIFYPAILLVILGFPMIAHRPASDYTLTFIMVSSMASFNVGAYYILSALTSLKAFFGWTVPFRTLTFIVFTTIVLTGRAPVQFLGIPVWEFFGAICTGIAMWYESRQKAQERAYQPVEQTSHPTLS